MSEMSREESNARRKVVMAAVHENIRYTQEWKARRRAEKIFELFAFHSVSLTEDKEATIQKMIDIIADQSDKHTSKISPNAQKIFDESGFDFGDY